MAKGRKPKIDVKKHKTDSVYKLLKEAFLDGCTIEQACSNAGISRQTYYNYIEKHPKYLEEFERYREDLNWRAKRNIGHAIRSGDLGTSKWYAERKMKEEFSIKTEVNQTIKTENPIKDLLDSIIEDDIEDNIQTNEKDQLGKTE